MQFAMKKHITPFEDDPSDFERMEYADSDKEKILSYMKAFEPDTAAGLIWDCVAGEEVREENVGFYDGQFIWSTQDIYHIEKYNAAVCNEFLKHVLEKSDNSLVIDFKKHPITIQYYSHPMFRRSYRNSLLINLQQKTITVKRVDDETAKMEQRVYEVTDDDMADLFSFFTIEAIEKYDHETDKWCGYRDEGYRVDYRITCYKEGSHLIDGNLSRVYENNPVEKALEWASKILPETETIRV